MTKSPFPPASQQHCGNCHYCRVTPDEAWLECRVNPPSLVSTFARWPTVDIDEWCGAWSPASE